MKKYLKKETGITLVALVITIIILLILAGISIATLTGSGLFENAKLAKQKSKNAQELEDLNLKDYEDKINEIVSGDRDSINDKTSEKYWYKEVIDETVVQGNINEFTVLKSYTIPDDGIYIVEFYSHWKDYLDAPGPRYNVVQQLRGANSIELEVDGDAGYTAGGEQYTITTGIYNCKKDDILKLAVSQYSGGNKTVSGQFKLTRLY